MYAKTAVGVAFLMLVPSVGVGQMAELYDVGGYQVEAVVQGEGDAIVVIEAGLGQDWRQWAAILDEISEFSVGVAYARAGYAGSDASPEPRTPVRIVEELRALLSVLEVEGPYVLVGHSFGGLTMQVFASQYPDEVAGLLLVDSSHVRQAVEMDRLDEFEQQLNEMQVEAPGTITDEVVALWEPMREGVLPEATPLPDVPLIILTSLMPSQGNTLEEREIIRGLHEELFAEVREGSHIVTSQAGHDLHLEDPELVIGSIRRLVQLSTRVP